MSVQPDWAAWNRLPPDEQASRIRRHVSAHGREMTDPEARRVAEQYMADREGKRARLTGRPDEERSMSDQGRHREELAAMDRQSRRGTLDDRARETVRRQGRTPVGSPGDRIDAQMPRTRGRSR